MVMMIMMSTRTSDGVNKDSRFDGFGASSRETRGKEVNGQEGVTQ